jgi:hypothetical protein
MRKKKTPSRAFFSQNNKLFSFVLFAVSFSVMGRNYYRSYFILLFIFGSTNVNSKTLYYLYALKTKGKIQKLRAKEFN